MSGWVRIANSVLLTALALWIAAAASAGIAAIGVFTTLKTADVRAPAFQDYLGDDGKAHGELIGGMVMEPIFTATDMAQAALAVIVVIAAAAVWFAHRGRKHPLFEKLRLICVALAVGITVHHMAVMAPRMNRHLREYWEAARINDRAAAEPHHTAFEADHVTAERLANARFFLLLAAMAASGFITIAGRPASISKP